MTTDTLPKSLPTDREDDTLPRVIVFTFWFTLILSVAGNVAANWGHFQDAIIGGLFPVLLVLAERVLHAAGRAPWWVRVLIGAVAVACMTWSAVHLASLAHGWMRWLIPVAVDALLLLSGLLIVVHSSQKREAPREAPLPEMVQEAPLPQEASLPRIVPTLPAPSPIVVMQEAPRETPSYEETETETVTQTRTISRRVSGGDLSELVSRLREGVERGETKPTISAAKTYLGVGHSKAKDVVSLLLQRESENA